MTDAMMITITAHLSMSPPGPLSLSLSLSLSPLCACVCVFSARLLLPPKRAETLQNMFGIIMIINYMI